MAILEQAAFNIAAAAALAPLAFASRWLVRPAVTHALWLIVLARLVMPAVWTVSSPLANAQPTNLEASIVEGSEPTAFNESETSHASIDSLPFKDSPTEPTPDATPPSIPSPTAAIVWQYIAIAAWLAGTLLYVAVFMLRAVRWRRLVTEPADQRAVDMVVRLARRLGLKCPPQVLQTAENVSPCVWTFGPRPVLLLPAGGFNSLSRLQQAAVVVHELAHLRRRDHWVRWFEFLISSLYWWFPVVWIARRELRAAEELCCDEWVIATLPAARRAYADALVDTVDHVATARPALPMLASGLGGVRELERRIRMILSSRPAGRPGRFVAALTLGAALVILPWSLAQPPRDDDGPRPERRKDQDGPPPEKGDKGPFRKGKDGPPRDHGDDNPFHKGKDGPPPGEKMRRRIDGPAGEVDRIRAELDELHRTMERLSRRLRELEGGPGREGPPRGDGPRGEGDRKGGPPPRPDGDRRPQDDERRRAIEAERRAADAANRSDAEFARRRTEEARREMEKERRANPPRPPRDGDDTPRPPAPPRPPREVDGPTPPAPPGPPPARAPGGQGGSELRPMATAQRRIEELEKELAELRKELAELRRARERGR